MIQTSKKGPDGYCHPASEEELLALVQLALSASPPLQLRVRGSAHSVARSIYTDGYSGAGAPPDGAMDVMLDRYRAIGPITPVDGDPDHAIVEVEAGCNLGKNPYDPTQTSTWRNSLDYTLQQAGWALEDLGGISHQTVSGFLSTGSSGGSLMYSIDDDIVGFNLIDGTGKLWVVNRDDADQEKRDLFFAAGVSMGLLGVISKVRLRVRRSFNLKGSQITSSTADAPIDLFGDGSDGKPSLERFLRETPYTRLMWWPQNGFERVQIWQASRIDPEPGFKPKPYEELGRAPQLTSLAGSLFYTLIGNLDDISAVPGKLTDWYAHLDGVLSSDSDVNACSGPTPDKTHTRKITQAEVLGHLGGVLRDALARRSRSLEGQEHTRALLGTVERKEGGLLHDVIAGIITELVALLLNGALGSQQAQILASFLEREMPYLIKDILSAFVPIGTQEFWDTWMCGLPMDNQMDDQLWPTWFTELWIPVEKTADVMRALKTWYDGGGDAATAYQHAGSFSCELYAARKSEFWMSPSYGADVFRVDVFWFALNGGDLNDFYKPFWELLKPFGFRPHWGKFAPPPSSGSWVDYYRQNFPRFDDFIALRAKLDPQQIFVNDYWRANLGIPARTKKPQ
ncbi:D-arabinono-1,4-lactone oxidase [Sorangium sp. So ce1014]|uniref:D-arabinono-1,4-lactone oxidase n=1 Tax=Sorangium sp. So ce1014 TaxID=3133326 RepID=UPI003F5EFAAA